MIEVADVADVATPDEARPTASSPVRSSGAARRQLLTAAGVIVLVGLWELLARTLLEGSYVLAAPSAIVGRIADEFTLYRRNLQFTTWNALQGFVWGNLAAIGFAVVAVVAPITRRVVSVVALTVFCLPLVALAPILRVVLGPGTAVPISLGALAVFFTTLVAALVGLRSAPSGPLELVASYGRGRWTALAKVRARAAIPALVAGLQVAAPAAFLGALIGEFAGAEKGFGVLTISALRSLETDRVWAIALASTVVSCGAYVLIGVIGRHLTPWSADVSLAARLGDVGASRRALNGFVGVLASLAVVGVLWVSFLRFFDVDPFFAKGPVDVWRYLVTEPDAAAQRAEVFDALRETLGSALLGFTVGMIGAVVLAAVFVSSPVVERLLTPVAVALRAVPIVATTPLIILALGRGIVGTTAIVAVMSFFPTLVNVTAGMRQTPGRLLDVVRSYDAPAWAVLWKARLPSSLPAILASARIAVPVSLLGATVAEWLATGGGMGDLMIVSASLARYDVLWSCVAVLTLTAVVGYGVVAGIEGALLRRYAPEQARGVNIAAERRATLDEVGAVHVPGALDGGWIDRLRAAIERCRSRPGEHYGVLSAPGAPLVDSDLFRWFDDPDLHAVVHESPLPVLAGQLLDVDAVVAVEDQWFASAPAATTASPWHQDDPYYNIDRSFLTIWVALDDAATAAALRVVPGSHRWGRLFAPVEFASSRSTIGSAGDLEPVPDVDSGGYEVLGWDVAAGDAVALDSRTLHAAGGEPSSGPFRRLSTRWATPDARYEDRGPHVASFWHVLPHGLQTGDLLACETFPLVRTGTAVSGDRIDRCGSD